MVGRLAPWKGQDLFLRAFATAFPDGKGQAVIVGSALFGESDYAASLHELARELDIAERVEFRGFVPDIAAKLAEFDVLVHASRSAEPFGQVVVEGMAAGMPVIAANCGGPAEIIDPGVTGLLFSANEVDELASALVLLRSDPDLRQRLGQAGKQRSMDFAPETPPSRWRRSIATVCRTPLFHDCNKSPLSRTYPTAFNIVTAASSHKGDSHNQSASSLAPEAGTRAGAGDWHHRENSGSTSCLGNR